mgnify:CR=1 FL=1
MNYSHTPADVAIRGGSSVRRMHSRQKPSLELFNPDCLSAEPGKPSLGLGGRQPAENLSDDGMTQLQLGVCDEASDRFAASEGPKEPHLVTIACGHFEEPVTPEMAGTPLRDDAVGRDAPSVTERIALQVENERARSNL